MGLSKDATPDEVKSAYHKLAHKYHPDISKEPDAETKFKELRAAYQVLNDPQKRIHYDDIVDTNGNTRGNSGNVISHFFGQLFGWNLMEHNSREQGQDCHVKVYIYLHDSIQGSACNIYLSTPEMDTQGHTQIKHELLNIKIPKGIKSGQYIRLPGLGQPGAENSNSGDLVLEIAFNNHPLYQVSETDIYFNLTVTPLEAKLGASIKVPTPKGSVNLKIPPKSRQGSKLRLKGCGLPATIPGDFLVILNIVRQSENTENAKKAYSSIQQIINFNI